MDSQWATLELVGKCCSVWSSNDNKNHDWGDLWSLSTVFSFLSINPTTINGTTHTRFLIEHWLLLEVRDYSTLGILK